jgi:hypothetical protein
MPSNKNLIYQELYGTLKIGEMYTRKSIKKLIEKEGIAVSNSDLKFAMTKLKKDKVIKFMKDSKFWIRLIEDKKVKEDKSLIPSDLFNPESLFNPKNVIKIEDLMKMLEGHIDKQIKELKPDPIDPALLIEGIDRVASRIVVEKLKDVTTDQYESIITATVKSVVKSEFKLNVIPAMLTNLRSHVDAEIEKKVKELMEINHQQEKAIKKYDDLFVKLKEMIDTKGGH